MLAAMGVVDRKLELFENIARLRRVGLQVPGSRDLAKVRTALERELGATVSQRLAARVLGVSHVALRRWIDAGDLPLVHTTEGRREVPVSVLLRLRNEIEEEGCSTDRYPIAPTMKRRREAAQRLHVKKARRKPHPHSLAHARGLAYHQAVARSLRRSMVEEAKHALFRWREEGRIDARYAERWEEILNQPVAKIRKAIVEESPAADDLRQNSPLAGLLSEAERRRIVKEVA